MDNVKTQTLEPQVTAVNVAADEGGGQEQDREHRNQVTVDFKMVTFSLSGKDYAIDIMNVKEIAKAGNFTYVPNTLPFVVGVYNLRGEIIPVLDMRLFFNIEVPDHSGNDLENLLILTVEGQTFGIIVDKIDKVVGIQKSTIQPPHPLFGDINVKYIFGVVESDKRLYILLDISRIFTKSTAESHSQQPEPVQTVRQQNPAERKSPADPAAKPAEAAAVNNEDSAVSGAQKDESDIDNQNYNFIVEALQRFKKFTVSEVNENWVKRRFAEWAKERGKDRIQFQDGNDAGEFLKSFWSRNTGTWWTKQYADDIYKLLPDNHAKQIVVWNPGCGNGMETYCLACVLQKRYPNAKIRIYAHDIDLLNVSNAPLLAVPPEVSDGWLAPYLSSKADGSATFSQEIKDSIMFEYHDCLHTNAMPVTDIIFARDLISMLDAEALKHVLSDFEERLKGNGLIIIGDNEIIPGSEGFNEHTVGALTAYNKQ